MQTALFRKIVADLDRQPELRGKRTADVPALAGYRCHYRRKSYQLATIAAVATLANAIFVVEQLGQFWPVNVFGLALGLWTAWRSESMARRLTRELRRPAAEQVARDLLGVDL